MSIYSNDLINSCGHIGELAAAEIEELEQAYESQFKELGKLRADLARVTAELEAANKDAARSKFLRENWYTWADGKLLPEWISANSMRLGGITKAIDAAMRDTGSAEPKP